MLIEARDLSRNFAYILLGRQVNATLLYALPRVVGTTHPLCKGLYECPVAGDSSSTLGFRKVSVYNVRRAPLMIKRKEGGPRARKWAPSLWRWPSSTSFSLCSTYKVYSCAELGELYTFDNEYSMKIGGHTVLFSLHALKYETPPSYHDPVCSPPLLLFELSNQ